MEKTDTITNIGLFSLMVFRGAHHSEVALRSRNMGTTKTIFNFVHQTEIMKYGFKSGVVK